MIQELERQNFTIFNKKAVRYIGDGTLLISSSGVVMYAYNHGTLTLSSFVVRTPAAIAEAVRRFREKSL